MIQSIMSLAPEKRTGQDRTGEGGEERRGQERRGEERRGEERRGGERRGEERGEEGRGSLFGDGNRPITMEKHPIKITKNKSVHGLRS